MNPVILHVDMDAFFVSVEQLYDSTLRGKPVIVGGNPNQRGVVAAASYEARRFGVHSAMPLTQAARLCPQAIFLRPHRERYQAASDQIREIFQEFSPQVEMVSVDEAYLNLTGTERLFGSPLRAAHLLHETIARKANLPCSIGIARSRVIAKIASDQAKPNSILWVLPEREAAFLAPLPVEKIPGVGKVTQKHLRELGVLKVGDLTGLGQDILESRLGQHGLALYALAKGADEWEETLDSETWNLEDRAKSISHEETFAQDVLDPAALDAVLADLSQRVAARLREESLFARTITLKLRYASFKTITRAETLAESTHRDGVILSAARRLLEQNWDRRQKVRLLGVQASGLGPQAGQANLWTAPVEEKWNRILTATDRLRERFGFSSVQLATALPPAETEKPVSTTRGGKTVQRSS
ncbi:MAG: DNA polymerase IV [Acidobacteria bacterium]|nr:DNA polymerase IV [Acidobacteriota bacterium]